MSNTMAIYAAGGAALNIASKLVKYGDKHTDEFAFIKTYFVDTSKSNIGSEISEDNVYLVDGLDGSGKKRDSNYPALSECCMEILHKFKPADVNVVIHSASGGELAA